MTPRITHVIQQYIAIADDVYSRYHSWDRCREVFASESPNAYHALELAFYLASWGMYRGSGGILQRNHLVHQGAVNVFYSGGHEFLKCSTDNEVSRDKIDAILNLKSAIAQEYGKIQFRRGNNPLQPISTTDTLMSKVILGTFGCVPAYDEFFIRGLKELGLIRRKFNREGLIEIFSFYEQNQREIQDCALLILQKTGKNYPVMKIIDMYFWQIGYDAWAIEAASKNLLKKQGKK